MAAEAIYAFKQSLSLCPESPEANFRLAQLYMELGHPEEALSTLQALQKLDPLNSKITGAIGQIISLQESRTDIPRLEAAHSNNPRDFNLMVQLGQAYAKAGQNDHLTPLLQGYLAQTNISSDDILQVAQLYMNLGQPDSAANTLQISTQRFPKDGRSYYSIAMIRAAQNNVTEALPMLARAIELTPEFRAKAATEQVFGGLRGNPQFQQLINSQ